jgi:hypothetical protein
MRVRAAVASAWTTLVVLAGLTAAVPLAVAEALAPGSTDLSQTSPAEDQRLAQQLLTTLRLARDGARSGQAHHGTAVSTIDLGRLRGLTRTQISSSLGKPDNCDRPPYCQTSAAWVYDGFPAELSAGAGTRLLVLFDADGHCATARWEMPK